MLCNRSFVVVISLVRSFLLCRALSSNNASMSFRLGRVHTFGNSLIVPRQDSCPIECPEGEQLCPGTTVCGTACCFDTDGDFMFACFNHNTCYSVNGVYGCCQLDPGEVCTDQPQPCGSPGSAQCDGEFPICSMYKGSPVCHRVHPLSCPSSSAVPTSATSETTSSTQPVDTPNILITTPSSTDPSAPTSTASSSAAPSSTTSSLTTSSSTASTSSASSTAASSSQATSSAAPSTLTETVLSSSPSAPPSSLPASGSSQIQTTTSQTTNGAAIVTVTAAQTSSTALTQAASISSNRLSKTAKIAMGVAIPVGTILILALIFILVRRRRRNRRWVQDNDEVVGGAGNTLRPATAAAASRAEKSPFIPSDRKARSSVKKKPVPGSIMKKSIPGSVKKHGYQAAERSEPSGRDGDDMTIRSDAPPPYA